MLRKFAQGHAGANQILGKNAGLFPARSLR
jgi:hypothetical protein